MPGLGEGRKTYIVAVVAAVVLAAVAAYYPPSGLKWSASNLIRGIVALGVSVPFLLIARVFGRQAFLGGVAGNLALFLLISGFLGGVVEAFGIFSKSATVDALGLLLHVIGYAALYAMIVVIYYYAREALSAEPPSVNAITVVMMVIAVALAAWTWYFAYTLLQFHLKIAGGAATLPIHVIHTAMYAVEFVALMFLLPIAMARAEVAIAAEAVRVITYSVLLHLVGEVLGRAILAAHALAVHMGILWLESAATGVATFFTVLAYLILLHAAALLRRIAEAMV